MSALFESAALISAELACRYLDANNECASIHQNNEPASSHDPDGTPRWRG